MELVMRVFNRRTGFALLIGALSLLMGGPQRSATAQPYHSGCSATVYWDANFGGESWTLHGSIPYVGDHWNDQISSIVVHRGYWVFFWDINYGGEALRLGPGQYPFVGPHWNDQISSARCVQPTG
jgi:hypothetical protein